MLKAYAPCKSGEYTELKVSVSYARAGYSYLTYKKERGGFYIHFSAVTRRDCGDGMMMESCTLMDGFKVLALEAERDSKKKAQAIFDKVREAGIMAALARVYESGDRGREILLILNKAGIVPAENYPDILMPKQAESEVRP